jgi:FkbM family methyltransferase
MKLLFYLSHFFKKAGYILIALSNKIYTTPYQRNLANWYKGDPKSELRFNYDLSEISTVFDLGGFKGQWASDIYARYCCDIYVFEPVENYVIDIQRRFQRNKKIKVFNFGLGDKNTELMISRMGDSSSLHKGPGDEKIIIHCFNDFMKEHNITHIDLLKLNIEGAEYDLLDHILENNLQKTITNIQIQFHDFVDNARVRMEKIQNELKKTHQLTYQQEFIWENWELLKVK